MIGLIVACLVAAGAITYFRTTGGREDLSVYAGEQVWLVCTNQSCGAQYEMDKQVYYETLKEKAKDSFGVPALECKDCGEESVFLAIKCEKCGKVFFEGDARIDGAFSDTCPDTDCGFSKRKEKRDNLRKKRQ